MQVVKDNICGLVLCTTLLKFDLSKVGNARGVKANATVIHK